VTSNFAMADQASDQAMADEAVISAQPQEDVLELAVREHARLVYRIAYSVLRNPAEAEDAVQEVFLRALRYGKKLADVDDQKAWLAKIAWRVAVEHRRHGARDGAHTGSAPEGEALPSPDLGAERTLLDKERGELLQRLIAGLPDQLRDPLVLSALEELSPREIGAMLGVSEAAVRSRAFRARQILRDRLGALNGPRM
jgi:RNA polymerase sigma-70 factor, ECF subfamily